MKFTVFGGTGRIGARVVARLRERGHQVVSASRSTGVDMISGTGVAEALAGADVAIDTTSSPTFDAAAADFFTTSVGHLLTAGQAAGVRHVVALSIVGIDRASNIDYYRSKLIQEQTLAAGPLPYSIVRATQFMEFVADIMSWTTDGDTVALPPTPIQPVAADDVADAIVEVALGAPAGGIVDVAGPEVFALDELGRLTLAARPDGRRVVTDPTAGLFAAVPGDALTDRGARLGPTHYRDWLAGRH